MTDPRPESIKLPTPGEFLDKIEPVLKPWITQVSQLGKEQAAAAEGDMRRGLVAMNGAGLLAVISLVKESLHPAIVHAAAAIYFIGLVVACVSWYQFAKSNMTVWTAESVFFQYFLKIREHPSIDKPIDNVDDLEIFGDILKNGIDKISDALKKPGQKVRTYVVLGLICFFSASLLLLVDFELFPLKPQTAATVIEQQTQTSSPELKGNTSTKEADAGKINETGAPPSIKQMRRGTVSNQQ